MNSDVKDFVLPDVGEGLTEAEVIQWHVRPGEVVEVNQVIVDIETAKSVVELPCPFDGVVSELVATEGETVAVGAPIIRIATGAGGVSTESGSAKDDGDQASDVGSAVEEAGAEPRLLVGYGATPSRRRSRRRRGAGSAEKGHEVVVYDKEQAQFDAGPVRRSRAKPPVRKLAKDLGVDLELITGSGPGGHVVRSDVLAAADQPGSHEPANAPSDARGEGAERRIPIRGVRRLTAEAMVSSAFTAPHVTEFVAVDITRTLDLRRHLLERREFDGVKVSPLVFVARAFMRAIERTPAGNARWDDAAQEIVVPRDINLGIAAATPRGLVVPNIKGAQALGLVELATAINQLAATARDGKTAPEDMNHGTTTITNVGVFGVDTGTPILNPGETSILAVGAIRRIPWVVGNKTEERVEPRSVIQLALSFDHRVLDGAEGSALLADTAEVLREPGLWVL